MSGFYEPKYSITGLSADDIQRITAGLDWLADIDDNNGFWEEMKKSEELMARIEAEFNENTERTA